MPTSSGDHFLLGEGITIRRVNSIDPSIVADVFRESGIIRPVDDLARIQRMFENSNLVFAAFDGETVVGIARAITDFSYATYLSDLAVRKTYQRQGIGKALIDAVEQVIGEESILLLVAGPLARDYYSHIGFESVPHAWIRHRKR